MTKQDACDQMFRWLIAQGSPAELANTIVAMVSDRIGRFVCKDRVIVGKVTNTQQRVDFNELLDDLVVSWLECEQGKVTFPEG